MHELGSEPKNFVRPSLTQWAASKIFISFYVFNFSVIFYAALNYVYFKLQKDSSSLYNFKFHHAIPQHRAELPTSVFCWGDQTLLIDNTFCMLFSSAIQDLFQYDVKAV
jgi:hypothetical protein